MAPVQKQVTGRRTALSLKEKMAIISRFETGEKVAAIARALRLSRTTVSTIVHSKARILEYVKNSGYVTACAGTD